MSLHLKILHTYHLSFLEIYAVNVAE